MQVFCLGRESSVPNSNGVDASSCFFFSDMLQHTEHTDSKHEDIATSLQIVFNSARVWEGRRQQKGRCGGGKLKIAADGPVISLV